MAEFTFEVAGQKEGPFPSFTDAFSSFWARTQKMISEGASEESLETSSGMEAKYPGKNVPITFSEARNIAESLNLFDKDDKLIDPLPEVDPLEVESEVESEINSTRNHKEMAEELQRLEKRGEPTEYQMKDGAHVRRGYPLFIWRVFILSVLGVLIGFFFELNLLLTVGICSLGIASCMAGCGFLLQDRAEFVSKDHRNANLAGIICLLLGAGMIIWRLMSQLPGGKNGY